MAILPTPKQSSETAVHSWMESVGRGVKTLENSVTTGKAGVSQTFEQSFLIEYPENKDYRVVINAAVARTITSVTTRSSTGTCTLTAKINTTALGGGANAVSTTEQVKTHTTANVMAAGDDLVLTVSANSAAENVSVTVSGTLTLAT